MKGFSCWVILVLLLTQTNAGAHELIRKVSRGSAVVIELSYPDHSPFSYEQFEVYREGEKTPYQTGRSDALGRIVFVPDRDGVWRIRAFSEDGHGIDMTVQAAPGEDGQTASSSGVDRYVRTALGLVIIVGVFIVALMFVRRRNP